MRLRFHAWQLAALLAVVCCAVIAGLYWYRTRGGTSPAELVAYLPLSSATTVYVDVDAVRRSGLLNRITGSKAAEEIEYKQFVDATLFDYRQDLDAVAAEFHAGQVYFALRGRFHWKNLMDYAAHQGGSCKNGYCVMAGSRPDRRISFYALRSNTMALAVAADDYAAYQIARKPASLNLTPPAQPLWAVVPAEELARADSLPAGVRPYIAALKNAEQIVFAVGPSGDHLELALNVTCRDARSASALLENFDGATNQLRSWTAREHPKPDPADFTAVLLGGSFHRDDRRVLGTWPLPRGFVEAVAGGAF